MNSGISRRTRPWRLTSALYSSVLAVSALGFGSAAIGGGVDRADLVNTASPIKHVIIIVGENRGFDHTFGTYTPKGAGQTVNNLLSRGIVNADGTPGPNYAAAQQNSVAAQSAWYFGAPNAAKFPYTPANQMPQPNTNGASQAPSATATPLIPQVAVLERNISASDVPLLSTGATGLPQGSLDTRVPGAGSLLGPFPLQGPNISDDDYTGDQTHRFFQGAQQQDCSIANISEANPTGCLNDLFAFVMATHSATDKSQGNEMGFYNVAQGQATLLAQLADRFTLSDNFHQSFLGGTGANHVMLGTGDAVFWTDLTGNVAVPPAGSVANPDPVASTVNRYTVDGNFVNCSDNGAPGVQPITNYLTSLPYHPGSNCQPGHYYMINNLNPGYMPNGALAAPLGGNASVVPPSSVRTIGDSLNDKGISWAYFGGAYNDAVVLANKAAVLNPNDPNAALTTAAFTDPAHTLGIVYCQICNPFSYTTSIMADATQRTQHIKDSADLITGINTNTLPSVSIVKPDGLLDGHPESSKIDLFEAYVRTVLTTLQKNPHMMSETAVFITWDEAGGYYDSGFVQPLDFFGDGPRMPLLVLSPYSTGGKIHHTYGDHASLLKFIERNWSFGPITNRSRDNLPNPTPSVVSAYVPGNMPAIGDLFDAFDFTKPQLQPYLP